MSLAFDEFKTRFDDYLEHRSEPPAEMYFLRYESDAPLLDLVQKAHAGEGEETLEEHLHALDECQEYAIDQGVTSTYIFFNPAKYEKWRQKNHLEDTLESRARWGAEQVPQQVDVHPSPHLTWYVITGNPKWYRDVVPPHMHAN